MKKPLKNGITKYKNDMEYQENEFAKIAIEYREQYESLSWWKFKKRAEAKSLWRWAMDLMVLTSQKKWEDDKIRKIVKQELNN